jgi:hypothetical protein
MEVSCSGEWLSDQLRAYDLSVADDKLTIGLISKGQPRQSSDEQRIGQPQKDCRNYCVQAGCNDVFFHNFL